MGKVVEKGKIEELTDFLKTNKKTIVFTNGCFDILHIGHVRYLKDSKKFGDILIVGLNSDASVKQLKGNDRPINNENDRAELLCELNCVDYVVIFDDISPINLIETIKPNIYTKGADYTIATLPEADTVLKNGGWIEFISFTQGKSTTKIIDKLK